MGRWTRRPIEPLAQKEAVMKRLLVIGLLMLCGPAAAQERVLGFTEGAVQVRSPGETTWRSVPGSMLPPNAQIRGRSQDNWVEVLGADGQPLQVRWNNVRQMVAPPPNCVAAAPRGAAAGSQGLGARGC